MIGVASDTSCGSRMDVADGSAFKRWLVVGVALGFLVCALRLILMGWVVEGRRWMVAHEWELRQLESE